MAIFDYKTGDFLSFWLRATHPVRLQPNILRVGSEIGQGHANHEVQTVN